MLKKLKEHEFKLRKIGNMQLKLKLTYLLLVFVFAFGVAQDDDIKSVSFVAKVSKKKLGINERLRVDFIMDHDGDNFNPPSFDGFRDVVGPNTSISNTWVNGKGSYSKTYSFFITPKKLNQNNQTQQEKNSDDRSSRSKSMIIDKLKSPKSTNDVIQNNRQPRFSISRTDTTIDPVQITLEIHYRLNL